MSDQPAVSASEIQTAIHNLETAHRRVTELVDRFEKKSDEDALAREIFNDIDRALAKLRFLFTTLETAGEQLRTDLECVWGECPRPRA
ncbi:MAG: hypothetical protein QNJ04_05430 [Desulfobacterales bacterium]|nr:hypothetical protein [Desulfobacterales bacterium]